MLPNAPRRDFYFGKERRTHLAPNDYLERWPVSKRVNCSKADANDAALIEPEQMTVA
jgi:hypothetical protein